MKILKRIVVAMMAVAVVLAAMWFWFVYAPKPPMPALAGELKHYTLNSGGIDRSFNVYVPEGSVDGAFGGAGGATKRRAVVFVFHGSRGTAERVRMSPVYEFDVLADKLGYLVVYPQGYKNHWHDCRGSADYAANVEDIDDVTFVRNMLDFLDAEFSIDRSKVFATGHSNGGQMAYRLALEAPELVAAIASISASLPDAEHLACAQQGVAVPVAIFNGTEDPVNPHEGGLVTVLGNTSRGVVLSSEATAQYWARLAGVTTAPQVIIHPQTDGDESTTVIEQRWRQGAGPEVRLYTLQGSGHVIPTPLRRYPRALGGDARDISGVAEMIGFFRSQP